MGRPMRLVSDEVWRQLDPHAGRLDRRTGRRLRRAGLVAVLATVLTTLTWLSGAVVPRLTAPQELNWQQWEVGPDRVALMVTVRNDGWTPVGLLSAGRSGRGLQLLGTDGFAPRSLGAGDTVTFTLVYRVADCAAVPPHPWPVPIRVTRPWGEMTSYVGLPTRSRPPPGAWYSYTARDPYAVEWQRFLAEDACAAR